MKPISLGGINGFGDSLTTEGSELAQAFVDAGVPEPVQEAPPPEHIFSGDEMVTIDLEACENVVSVGWAFTVATPVATTFVTAPSAEKERSPEAPLLAEDFKRK